MSRIFVIIASIGRAELLAQTVTRLAEQTRQPDGIIVVSVCDADVAGLEKVQGLPLEVIFAEKGLPRQRNAGLRHLNGRADVVAFFDDDFLPADNYLEELGRMFETDPRIAGLTGRLIADGIKTPGLSFERGIELIAEDAPPHAFQERILPALYGCNLSFRASAAQGIWFDEALPLYGWQEDVDFSFQLGARGILKRTERLAGVHLGAKGGRTSGKRLGYSQIANPVYLLQKKTIPPRLAWRLMTRNLLANLMRSIFPEAHVDRSGRLWGNIIAMYHFTRGKLHPEQILSF